MTLLPLNRALIILMLSCATLSTTIRAAEPMALALFAFSPNEPALEKISADTRERLQKHLAELPGVVVVGSEQIDRLLSENDIIPSATNTSANIKKIGELAGAKIVVSGQVLDSGGICYLIAKVSAIETPRIFTATTTHPSFEDLETHVVELTAKIADILKKNPDAFVAQGSPTN